MFSRKLTSISIATLATLGALALSAQSASAGSRGLHVHVGFGHGHHLGYRPWRHDYRWGIYGAPVVYRGATYVHECFYVRRRGKLFKVCE